jgi:AraC-like DNA-binding protein
MSDDPFSAILDLVDARAVCAGGFYAGGDWAVAFPPPDKLKFLVIARGCCWLTVEGMGDPFRMRQGEVLMLAVSRSYVAASDPALAPRSADEIFGAATSGIHAVGDGEEVLFLGGHVDLASGSGALLLESLPDMIRIDGDSAEAPRLKWLIAELAEEYDDGREGSDFACGALAQLIFLNVLRAHLAREGEVGPGWLGVLVDRRLAPALRLIHAEPARAWRLPELARAAAMSRTAFATRFKARAGVAPLAYLAQWRMRLAQRWLAEGAMPIGQIARAAGFTSDAAFSNAFKRLNGEAPSQFRLRSSAKPAVGIRPGSFSGRSSMFVE